MNRNLQIGILALLGIASVNSTRAALEFRPITSPAAATLNAISTDANGNFVAVGNSGTALFLSFSGSNVTVTPAPGLPPANLATVTFGGGRFAASGDNSVVLSSVNGTNWTSITNIFTSTSLAAPGITFNPNAGMFAAVSASRLISRSSDLTNWAAANIPDQTLLDLYRAVTSFSMGSTNGFIACGIGGLIRRSTDGGANWSVSLPPFQGVADLLGIASDGVGTVLAVGASGTILVSTSAGAVGSWATNFAGIQHQAATYSGVTGSEYVIVGVGGLILSSSNGVNWTTNAQLGTTLRGVAFGRGGLMQGIGFAVGDGGSLFVGGTRPNAPTSAGNQTNCANALPNPSLAVTVVNDAIFPAGTLTVDWYSAASGGTAVLSNSLNYLPLQTAAGTYTNYAETRDLRTGLVSATRTPVIFRVLARPVDPVSQGNQTNCANALPNPPLVVTALTTGITEGTVTVDWYNAPTGGTLLASNTASFMPTNTAAGTYTFYAESRLVSDCGCVINCVSTNRTAVVLHVLARPVDPVSQGNQTNCSNSLPNPALLVTAPTTGITEGTVTVDWYSAPTGGMLLATGTTSFIPTNTVAGTYTFYAESRLVSDCGCVVNCVSTNRTPVILQINPTPLITALAGPLTNCLGVPVTLTVSLGGSVGPWNLVWSDGLVTNGVTSPFSRQVNPAVAGVTNYSLSSVVDAVTACPAATTNLAAFTSAITVENCNAPLTIQQLTATNVVVSWYGNLRLLRSDDLAPPAWSLIATGNPGMTNRWTNSIIPPPLHNFFRLTNAP